MRLFYLAGRLLPRRASPTRLSNVVQGARQARALPWTRRIGGALRTPGTSPQTTFNAARPFLVLWEKQIGSFRLRGFPQRSLIESGLGPSCAARIRVTGSGQSSGLSNQLLMPFARV